ncbi:MAG: DUF1553 domain-containing protein [Verrucomicrobia bacterium]|nr:DUF1553 domain-containing protein [Verrucomicrobiota bacterium]
MPPVDFNFQVRPLLSDRCFSCHGPDERARKAKLRLDTADGLSGRAKSGLAIVAALNREASELWRRITNPNLDDRMPPSDSHLRLNPDEIETLGRWIEEGAKHKPHWSFIPVERVEVPRANTNESVRTGNEIDAFVRAKQRSLGLRPASEATQAQWLRRVSLDLVGLPPTLEEMDAFSADTSADAYEKVVDRLLASPAYGERMASEWLDLARYADTYGYQADVDRDMSAWRDWVIRAFNSNLRWDQFILWQIAGDMLPGATHDQKLATAFNRLHRQTNEGGSIEEEFRNEYVSDRVHTAGTAFLGLTLECCRCHDHKFDPISQRDYYRLSAFFNNIDESGLYSHFTQATPTPTLPLYGDGQESLHRELIRKVADAEARLISEVSQAGPRFEAWRRAPDRLPPPPQPVAAFDFDQVVANQFLNRAGSNHAALVESPVLVSGKLGQAVSFSGDNSVVCRKTGRFHRTDPFSLSFWIRPTEAQARAVVLHCSRAWTDSGSRGYELVLDAGRPRFALIHFWPGNAISARARAALPLNAWSQLTATYDGSSRAEGLKLYIDGRPVDVDVEKDHLYRDIDHRGEWGDSEAGSIDLALGGRFRDSGFRNGALDDLKVFDVCLTGSEVAGLMDSSRHLSTIEDFAARVDERCRKAASELQQAREEENRFIAGVREIMVMKELAKRRQTYVLRRGAYDAPGDLVDAGVPERIMPLPSEYPGNRLGLARWMIDRRHPLTARVAVNRIWKLHFGRGLVTTTEDFGAQGALPSHPELLDWLAFRFMESGWDRKALHRLIALSSTYRQDSKPSTAQASGDPDNRWLTSGPRHRLLAEQIRDEALAASGLLTRRIGWRSVKPYQPVGVWEEAGTGKSYTPDKGDNLYRRSLYTFWRRTAPPPSMLSFDATSREVCTAKREVTTTPLQALVLLNDVQFLEASRVMAEGLARRHPGDVAATVSEAFRRLINRSPEARESEVLQRLYREQREFYSLHVDAAEKLLAAGDRAREKGLPTPELAAITTLVSTLMNHDEFVMKR